MTDVAGLLARMTLEEKCAQLTGTWFSELCEEMEPDDERMAARLSHGIGHVSRVSAQSAAGPGRTSAYANRIQRFLLEGTRLGIPAVIHEEAVAGFCAREATQFPQAIGLASTWDPQLIEAMAHVIGRQMRAVGARLALSPVLDIARDPRWGRLEESYGEDPELVSRMAVAYVRGLQSERVGATLKHFGAHGIPGGGLNWAAASAGRREILDVLTAPFRAAIQEAGAESVMPSYNEVDGLPSHGSSDVLSDLLRHDLGFAGVTVADYFGITCLSNFHHQAEDGPDAALIAVQAGLDIELPTAECYSALPKLVSEGKLPVEMIDEACLRVLQQKERLGLFDDPYVDEGRAKATFDTATDRGLARRAATQSLVLLTNDGTLPIRPGQRVAVIGPSADDSRLLLGDYHFPAHLELSHQPADGLAPTAGSGPAAGLAQVPTMTVLAAMQERLGELAPVDAADVVVVCVGGRSGLRQDDTSGEFRDSADLRLPADQLQLLAETFDFGLPTVVVVIGGRAHTLTEVVPSANSLLLAWLPGEEGGPAIADALLGASEPGGRLPVTLLRSVGQVGLHSGIHHGAGRSMIYGEYVEMPSTPLFPFGHGLSYTTWEYSDLLVDAASTDDEISVSVTVTNTGERRGGEMVQIYFSDDVASIGLPAWRLLAFRRIEAEPGERVGLHFGAPAGRLGFTGSDLRYRVEPGAFTFRSGGLETTATLTGEVAFPDRNSLAPASSQIS